MNNVQIELRKIMKGSIKRFDIEQNYLLKNDASERNMCSALGRIVEEELRGTQFEGYVSDVEYSRGYNGVDSNTKRLKNDGGAITLDLIIHKRGYDELRGYDNLICVEMKKTTNSESAHNDMKRLRKLTTYKSGFGYKVGFMLVANINAQKLTIEKAFYLKMTR